MKKDFLKNALAFSLAATLAVTGCSSKGNKTYSSKSKLDAKETRALASEAYIYAYPLVLSEVTMDVMTATPQPSGLKAPLNQISSVKKSPDADFKDIVSPNVDTLYTMGWLDLSTEPLVLSVPDMRDRYYLMQVMDAWTNVIASPGTRTTGNGKSNFAIVGPYWSGNLPEGVQKIQSPTNLVWLGGRIAYKNPKDAVAVGKLQAQLKLYPLSQIGKNYSPPTISDWNINTDTQTPTYVQVANLSPEDFFARFANSLQKNPAALADSPMLAKLSALGITPGQSPRLDSMKPEIAEAFRQGYVDGKAHLDDLVRNPKGEMINGWARLSVVGRYGTDYEQRAVVARIGFGANVQEDAIYPRAFVDAFGDRLTGANSYTLHFAKEQLPPVNGFWSITMYNSDQFFVKNRLNRFAVSSRDKLKYNGDGSLDIYIQANSPGKSRESNWLPAPRDEFNMIARLYWPKESALNGNWQMPAVQKSIESNRISGRDGMD
jgi:hypothetical protein